jgi:RNA polymerase sigma-70 factor (ECF subfamily)
VTEDEFCDLYAHLREHVYRYALHRLRVEERALEVVSATFEAAWRKHSDLPKDQESRFAYVFGIAKNQVLQEHQRTRRKHHDNRFVGDYHRHPALNTVNDVADVVAANDAAVRVVQQLSPSDKELLRLAFTLRLNSQQVADILDISLATYAVRVSRLRRRIDAISEAQGDVDDGTSRSGALGA